jgi:hypothetical protein
MSEPVDQTTKVQIVAPEAQKIPKSTSSAQSESVTAQSTDALLDVTQRNGEIQSEPDANLLKDEKSVKKQLLAGKTDTVAVDDTIQTGKAKETLPSQTSKEISVNTANALVPEKQTLGTPKVQEAPKDDIKQEVDVEELKEKAVPDTAGEDAVTAAALEPGVEKVGETEVPPPSAGPEKEMGQKTSEEDINRQKNELNRLKSFLDSYCQAYTNKNLDKFITFFTLDATENNTPFHELLPDYRKNMEGMESLTYRIELMSFSKQTASGNLMIRGRFFTRYQSQKGVWEEHNGSIFMELLEKGDSFLIKQLNY